MKGLSSGHAFSIGIGSATELAGSTSCGVDLRRNPAPVRYEVTDNRSTMALPSDLIIASGPEKKCDRRK